MRYAWLFYLPSVIQFFDNLQLVSAWHENSRFLLYLDEATLDAKHGWLLSELGFVHLLWVLAFEYLVNQHHTVFSDWYNILVSGAKKCVKHPVVMTGSAFGFAIVLRVYHHYFLLIAGNADVPTRWRIFNVQYLS